MQYVTFGSDMLQDGTHVIYLGTLLIYASFGNYDTVALLGNLPLILKL